MCQLAVRELVDTVFRCSSSWGDHQTHIQVIQQCVSKLVVGNLVRLATVACHKGFASDHKSGQPCVIEFFGPFFDNPCSNSCHLTQNSSLRSILLKYRSLQDYELHAHFLTNLEGSRGSQKVVKNVICIT